jgi:hypothetical protein
MSYSSPVVPASGTTFAQFQQGGFVGMLDRVIVLMPTLTSRQINHLRKAKVGNLQDIFRHQSNMCRQWNQGRPMAVGDDEVLLYDYHLVWAVYASLSSEIGALMDANPGTLGLVPTPLNAPQSTRTWP